LGRTTKRGRSDDKSSRRFETGVEDGKDDVPVVPIWISLSVVSPLVREEIWDDVAEGRLPIVVPTGSAFWMLDTGLHTVEEFGSSGV
jgi:hypothetical protein